MEVEVAKLELRLNMQSNRVSRLWFPAKLAQAFNSIIQVMDSCKGINALLKDKEGG